MRTNATVHQEMGTGAAGSAGWGEVLSNGHLTCTAEAGSDGTQNAGSATSDYTLTTTWTWFGGGTIPNPAYFTGHGDISSSEDGTGSASATVVGTDFGFSRSTPTVANGVYSNQSSFTPVNGVVTARMESIAVAAKTAGIGSAQASSDVWVTYP